MRRVGLYPGTFDPVTLGHLDIVKRAVKLVDHLVIGVATNASKTALFTLDERVAMLKAEAEAAAGGRATIEVRAFDSLLVHFAAEVGASSRKLRARSIAIFWISASDMAAVSIPMPFRRCRADSTSLALSSSDSVPLWILREFDTMEVPMCPGITTEHLMCGALSRRSLISASVNPFTANLAEL